MKVDIGWLLRFFRFLLDRRSLLETLELSPKDEGELDVELLLKENSLGFAFENGWTLLGFFEIILRQVQLVTTIHQAVSSLELWSFTIVDGDHVVAAAGFNLLGPVFQFIRRLRRASFEGDVIRTLAQLSLDLDAVSFLLLGR